MIIIGEVRILIDNGATVQVPNGALQAGLFLIALF